MKRGWIVLFVALALFIGFEDVLGANCAIWPCNCGDTLTASVTMGGDLSCTSDGLIVGANSITLDCASYSINRTNFNSDYGVRSSEYANLIIKNCKFNNFSRAINIDFSANNLILNNTINNSIVYGISLDVNNSQIENNSVYNTNDKGIFLSGSNNNLTSNFVAQSADIGIMVGNGEDGSYNTTLIRNIIVNSGGNGLYFYSQANYTTFLNNTVQNNTAYGLRFLASSSLFENNTFISNNLEDGQGFYVGGSSNKIYRNIFIEHDTNALQLGGSNASVQYNTINHSSNNGSGIIDFYTPVSATLINQILHNTIYGHSKGISLSSRYSLVQNNTLTNNTYAVFIDGAGSNEGDYNNVTQNIMANNTYGVYFQYLADYNIINDNVIKNNSYGITFFHYFLQPLVGYIELKITLSQIINSLLIPLWISLPLMEQQQHFLTTLIGPTISVWV